MADAVLSVLIVEDLDETAQSLAELLGLHGHAVQLARTGPEALAAVENDVPDVVLLDIGLPGMSGWEVAARLRARAAGRQPVVIALTGYGTDADRWTSADSGIDLHLVKPADPTALTAMLARVGVHLASARPRAEDPGGA